MSDNSGGGKSTLVQSPQKSRAPIATGTSSKGFVRNSKKDVMTAGDFNFKAPKPEVKTSYAPPPVNPYPEIGRNDNCGCGSRKKYKKCCLG